MKDHFIVHGLGGEKILSGTININGAKNAALKAMAASILFGGEVTLNNIPDTEDIHTLTEILHKLGCMIEAKKDSEKYGGLILKINSSGIKSTDIDFDLARTMRASIVLSGPLLARFRKLTFPAPGGCVIGARPIDLFLDGYAKMGATSILNEGNAVYELASKENLKGANIFFEKISVGATETLMMSAVLANGKTVLKNCATEPEIGNVAAWLNECGADIKGVGTSTIEINGTNGKLLAPNTSFVTIPDRIEAGSYVILGALCAKDLVINNCRPDHMESLTNLLIQSGVPLEITDTAISIKNNIKPNSEFMSFNVRTQEYPGLATDIQAPMAVFLTQVTGESTILETIFEGRFKYVEDLIRMGANVKTMNPREILIKGPSILSKLPDDEELNAHDIRAGFAIVLAALVGKGKFRINNVHLIDRGYEKMEDRMAAISPKGKVLLKRVNM